MNDFKCPFTGREWSAKQRDAIDKLFKLAVKNGEYPKPTKCNRCGKETGRIDPHNHSYDHPTDSVEPLCQGCHTALHRRYNSTGPNEIDRKMWEKFTKGSTAR